MATSGIFRKTIQVVSRNVGVGLISSYRLSSSRPKVLITQTVPPGGPALLAPHCDIIQWDGDSITRDELLKHVRGKDAIFCLCVDNVDAELLDAAGKQLKVISTLSVGYEHIDLEECKRRHIPVGYTPGVLTSAVAEYAITLLLATTRRLKEAMTAVTDGSAWGTWRPLWLIGQGLEGNTVGIVGMGRIGLAVAQRLRPFGIDRLLYCNVRPSPHAASVGAEYVTFDELLSQSDFVVACCTLTSGTTEMFNSRAFQKMKNSAIFINMSRGGVVQQDDLFRALKWGEIGGAGLDVTSPEPLSKNSPLLALNNCIVSPHIGSADERARNKMSELTAQNILAGLKGERLPEQVSV